MAKAVRNVQIGDFVKGKVDNGHGVTNENMAKGVVTKIVDNSMTVKVIEHTHNDAGTYNVSIEGFEVIGHQKE